jgi:4-diphosphocytidyl-2C-methyl-D-erythritol kinase
MHYAAITLLGLAADLAFALFVAAIIRAGRGERLAPVVPLAS